MVGLISLAVFILLGVVALWVKGIDEMHEKHPDYKGEDLFGEETKLQCKDCNDNLTDCTCIEDTVDMKQWPESTGDIFSDYAIGESKAIQNSMHLDAEIACRSIYKQENTADYIDRHIVEAMAEVAKQKMYSEEEVIDIAKQAFVLGANFGLIGTFSEWFEQFRKK